MTIEATPKEIADLVDLLLSRQNEKNDLKIDSNSIYQAAKNCYRSNSLMKENNFWYVADPNHNYICKVLISE